MQLPLPLFFVLLFIITCFSLPLISLPPALCHFSNSILEYLANLDKAPDPTVRKDTFSSEIFAAFDMLFNNWLQSREPKVRSLEDYNRYEIWCAIYETACIKSCAEAVVEEVHQVGKLR